MAAEPPIALPPALTRLLDEISAARGRVLVLTGAGISAESGVPTFRGAEGFWRVGSRNYHAQELATHAAFSEMPEEVWAWYLYRRGVCRAAFPNRAHRALVALEQAIDDRFVLITQNVDGLHARAGQSAARTFAIHGDIDRMRCVRACGAPPVPVPEAIDLAWPKERKLGPAERERLRCGACGAPSRPHILWFDEHYDEENYRLESSLEAAERADLLIIIGTSGATQLPNQVAALVARQGGAVVAVNPEPSPFTALAERLDRGCFVEAGATAAVPPITERLGAARVE
ncbi:MAG: RNA polymerase subunit sigma [Deltaproteobacteria bacterium]|nr:RNA polymerase subunit sigma [Deltaproteobacteria bacterium]